jgi:hypothetical protein
MVEYGAIPVLISMKSGMNDAHGCYFFVKSWLTVTFLTGATLNANPP